MQGMPTPADCWAKLKYKDDDRSTGEIIAWHPLLAHCADVAAVTEALLTRTILRKRLATLIGWDDLTDVHVARLSALAAIHDAGKVNHGFQEQAFNPKRRSPGHVRPIVEVLEADGSEQERLLLPLGIEPMLEWFPPDATLNYVLLATWGHHGKPVKPDDNFRPSLWKADSRRDPLQGLHDLADHTRRWFPAAFDDTAKPFPSDPALHHAFNGLLTLADWIGSDTRFFGFATSLDAPMPWARKRASEAIDHLFLNPSGTRECLGMEPIGFRGVLDPATPYAIQQACLDLPLHAGGSLTVLESDTGSGKTEAALARFVRLYQAGLVDGLYFAVPTRSAAMQLHGRIKKIVDRVFPGEHRPPVVQAVPGYLKADDDEATRLPGFKVLWDDEETMRYRGWAAEHPKRYLAGPIVVGTVDQVLLSALQVKHAHMRAAALLRHFLVVDEVHASDVYMTELTDQVLDQHLAAGGHALLMSATLGSAARVHLTTNGRQAPPPPAEAEVVAYPLLTHVNAARRDPMQVHAASSGTSKKVETELHGLADDPLAVVRLAAEQARAGARVLVIRNLVADCVATQRALEEVVHGETRLLFGVGSIPAPHHSRFAPADRKKLDRAIEAAFGKHRETSPPRGLVAVCTQTVEQSLDIDADLLITDLCPMDVLLQRIGRLHRHQRARPSGFETARCLVLTPSERDLSGAIVQDGRGVKGPHGLGTVYQDLRMIEAAWRVLADETLDAWHIPEHNRLLVERATHPEHLQAIVAEKGEAWNEHQKYILGRDIANRLHAGYVRIDRSKPFGEEGFVDDVGAVRTRLGDDNYRVDLPEPIPGAFGEAVDVLTLAAWQIGGEPPEDMTAENVEPMEGGFGFAFAGQRFRYDRFGVTTVS